VEECDLGAHQPATGGELRKEQDRQRAACVAAGVHQQRDEDDVAGEQGQQQRGQRQAQRFTLYPGERQDAVREIQARRGNECVRRADTDRAQIQKQRSAEQQHAAHRAIQADDPEYPPAGFGDHRRQRRRLERRNRRVRLHIGAHRLAHSLSAHV